MSDPKRGPGVTPPISLDHALRVLCQVHLQETSEDFVVLVGARPDFGNLISPAEYTAAWERVRREIVTGEASWTRDKS